jgi:hypothetical protein
MSRGSRWIPLQFASLDGTLPPAATYRGMPRKRTRRKAAANPFALGMDAWLLGAEAASVVALRGTRMALGGTEAQLEAQRMVAEKGEAAWDLGVLFATGSLGQRPETIARRTLALYGKRVRANRRRLTGG